MALTRLPWIAVLLLAGSLARAGELAVARFCGLNNAVDPAVIADCQSPDLLNVEANKTGTGIRKRDGYALFLTPSLTASSVNSVFAFRNQSGDECILMAAGDTVYRSVNRAAAVAVTTVTANARIYCQDNSGVAYCFTSSNDLPFQYNCATYTQSLTNNYPNGKFNAFTNDRHLVAGTTDQLNRLHISDSAAFSDFRTGNTDDDAWTEDLGTAGDRITAMSVLNGRPIIFKEYSIIGFNLTDQFNSVAYDISNVAGVAGPENIVNYNGAIYFKGSDNEFYVIDGSPGGIEKLSVDISSFTASLLTGKTRYNVQTEKTDWDAGILAVQGTLAPISAAQTVGSVEPSTRALVDTSSSDFAGGTTLTNISTGDVVGAIQISSTVCQDDFNDGNFTSGHAVWTDGGGVYSVSNRKLLSGTANSISMSCTVSTGSFQVKMGQSPSAGFNQYFKFMSLGTNITQSSGYALLYSRNSGNNFNTLSVVRYPAGTTVCSNALVEPIGNADGDQGYTVVRSTVGRFELFSSTGGFLCGGTDTTVSSSTHILMYNDGPTNTYTWDDLYAYAYFSTRSFVSRAFDTVFSTPTGGTITVSSAVPTGTTLSYQVRQTTSGNNDVWGAWTPVAYGDRLSLSQRYWQYQSTFATSYGTVTPRIDDVTLIAATTGQYVTQCISPGPGISAWGLLEAAGLKSCGSLAFDRSVAATCGAAGTTWTAQSTGTTIGGSVDQAIKVRVTYGLNSATCTARIDSLAINWTEGAVASPTYGAYWNNALYWAVQSTGTNNNRMVKYDLLNPAWYVFDIPANALASYNNILYFGGTTSGKVYTFSDVNQGRAPTSDDGAAINAYWKSKEFSGADPFVENKWNRVSMVARRQAGGSLTASWQLNGGDTASGSYSVGLSTGPSVVRHNFSLPVGQRGTFFNVKVGNNSTAPFEVFAVKFDYDALPWRVLP